MRNKINRRQFIKRTLTMGAALGVSSVFSPLANHLWAALEPPDLAIVKGPVAKATREAVNLLGGMKRFVKPGFKVLIKPNMSFPNSPSAATTTHPDLVATVARMCLDSGAKKVLIVDHVLRDTHLCLNNSGIAPACKNIEGVHVLAVLDEKFYADLPIPKGQVLNQVKVIKDVLKANLIINLPIAKSHSTTGVTMGLKNLMGLIWDREYFHKKVDINKAIADLNTAIKPQLTILDASRVLNDGGPGGPGKVSVLDTLVAGVDPVAVDSFGVGLSNWYGKKFSGRDVEHIVNAHQIGLGKIDTGKLRIKRSQV